MYSFIERALNGLGSEVSKVKGKSLFFAAGALINYDSIRSFIVDEREKPIILHYSAIRSTAFHHETRN